jgi:hypothetical protein
MASRVENTRSDSTELKTLSTLIDSVCNLRCRLLIVRCNWILTTME